MPKLQLNKISPNGILPSFRWAGRFRACCQCRPTKAMPTLLLEELTSHFIDEFFPGREVAECITFRITRNADVELREAEAPDLMLGMEEMLESRRQSRVVRLEYSDGASDLMLAFLSEKMLLTNQDLYAIEGPLDLTYLFAIHGLEGFEDLRDEPWPAQSTPAIDPAESMFSTMSAGDLLLVHPYESFDPVVRLIEEAAVDPDVLAIKQVFIGPVATVRSSMH